MNTVWLVGILILGTLLRLYRLVAWEFGLDEGYSGHVATKSLPNIWAFIARDDFHPPLFYMLVHLWGSLGRSEVWLRLLPVLFAIASIFLIYRIGAYLLDTRAGLLGALILALSPLHIWHSQELRMYAPVFCFSLIALDALARLIREDRTVHRCIYVSAMTLALYTDYGAFLVLAAHNVAAIALIFLQRRPVLWKWILTQVTILALYLPWASTLATTVRVVGGFESGMGRGPADPRALIFVLAQFTSSFTPLGRPLIKIAIVVVFGLVFLSGLLAIRMRRTAAILLGSLAVVPLVTGIIFSLKTHAFFPRVLIGATAGYYLILGEGFLALRRRHLGLILLIGLVGINTVSLNNLYYHTVKAGQWREIAGYVASQIRPGEGVIFVAGDWHRVFEFYYHGPEPIDIEGYNTPADLDRIRRFVNAHRVLYFVSSAEVDNDPTRQVRRLIQARFLASGESRSWGEVAVDRYVRTR